MSNQRVSLIDPLLYQSTYINPNPPKPLKINFWKKFNIFNFMFNIAIPIAVLIFVLFVLKEKYLSKIQKKSNKNHSKTQINDDDDDYINSMPNPMHLNLGT